MPIHAPGSRLFSTLPLNIHKESGATGGRKESNISLNVVPFVDMMTILVCFLLMTFSASGEILVSPKNLQLPDALNKAQLRLAPVIVISQDVISFNGEGVAEPHRVEASTAAEWRISQLFDVLTQEKTRFERHFNELPKPEQERCHPDAVETTPSERCLRGLLILQADKNTSTKVINRVLKTAFAAQYHNIMFAINSRSK